MQELIEYLENMDYKERSIYKLANILLEKEKEQIYDAFKAGGGMYDHHEDYYEIVYKK